VTIQGSILITVITAALALWMMSLVRRGRLYVGYAVVCLVAFGLMVIVACVSPLRHAVEEMLEYFFPRSGVAVSLAILGAIALIYVLSQLTIISNRLVRTVQRNAVREALKGGQLDTPSDAAGAVQTADVGQASTPRTARIET
jgi:hypothetical protein